jgi:hypothetical protein
MTTLKTPGDQPINYLVSDLGKPGVPQLSAEHRALVDRILRIHKSPTLRFVVLFPQFVVFDATMGPCFSSPLYDVLSARNEHYQPGENPFTPLGDPP